jgi:hypothetical protein
MKPRESMPGQLTHIQPLRGIPRRVKSLGRWYEMKFRMVEDCRDTWSVQALCRVLGISTAGYYAWRSRPDSKRTVEDHALLVDIRQVHADSGGRYGSPVCMLPCGHMARRLAAGASSA